MNDQVECGLRHGRDPCQVVPAEGAEPSLLRDQGEQGLHGARRRGAARSVVLKASTCATKYVGLRPARCATLSSSITSIVFNYIRRGLFDGDKLDDLDARRAQARGERRRARQRGLLR